MIDTKNVMKYTKNLSILIVEDHEDIRISTVNLLKDLFSAVGSSPNGDAALEEYKKYYSETSVYYDIILSDIEMPFMNGIELTEKIYAINPSQIVIIFSAFDESKYLLKLINLGIEQFIKKPIAPEDLLASFVEASHKITRQVPEKTTSEVILAPNVIYNSDTKSIKNANENVYLTKFEIIFIELLFTSFGKIYSNEDIVTHYTSLGENIDSSNIRKLVSKLRKKIPQESIESIYGIGYKFIPFYE